jgi:hypothetical protein
MMEWFVCWLALWGWCSQIGDSEDCQHVPQMNGGRASLCDALAKMLRGYVGREQSQGESQLVEI